MPRFVFALLAPLVVLACFAFVSERADAEEALASWYGPGFAGLPTASGETYDPYGFTAAHKTMPLGTELLVSYGGNSVGVTVNDRGPYVGERELDLSQGAAEVIGLIETGVDYVEYTLMDQYAVAPPSTLTDPAAVGAQYSSTGEVPYDSVSMTQYAPEAIVGDEQAGFEQAPQAWASVEDASVAAPLAPAPAADGAAGSVLVVRPGETLSGIAAEVGVPADYLAAQNAIGDPNFVYAGQVLYY